MNRALLSTQCLRLLKSEDVKARDHIGFWMGSLLVNIFPGLGNNLHAGDTPEHLAILGDCFASLLMDDMLT